MSHYVHFGSRTITEYVHLKVTLRCHTRCKSTGSDVTPFYSSLLLRWTHKPCAPTRHICDHYILSTGIPMLIRTRTAITAHKCLQFFVSFLFLLLTLLFLLCGCNVKIELPWYCRWRFGFTFVTCLFIYYWVRDFLFYLVWKGVASGAQQSSL